MRKTMGIFGGTFDPVHMGHLRLALELKQQLHLDEMRLLPCHQPPHRESPSITSEVRVQMLQLAVRNCAELQLDTREMARDKPSYTYDTLCELRAELGAEMSICFCMGVDNFFNLATWHRWQELIQLAHIVVVSRPGWSLPETGAVAEFLARYESDVSIIAQQAAGAVVMSTPRLLPISSTEIRALIKTGRSPQFLMPDSVWQFVSEHNLYK